MNICDPVGDQIYDLVGGVNNARLLHRILVLAEMIHDIDKALRHIAAGQLHGIFDL